MARTQIERMDTLTCFVLGTLYCAYPVKTGMTLSRLPDSFFPEGFDRMVLTSETLRGDRALRLEEQLFASGMRWLHHCGFMGCTPDGNGGFTDCKLTVTGLAILNDVPGSLGGTKTLGERMLAEAVRSGGKRVGELVSQAVTAAMTLRNRSYYGDHY